MLEHIPGTTWVVTCLSQQTFFLSHPDNSVVLLLFLTLAINLSKQESGRKQEATGLKEKKGEIVFWRLEQQQELRNSVAEEKPYRQKKKEWGRIKRMETQRQRGKEKTITRRRIEMRPYHFPQTLVAATTKSFRYAASDKLLSFGG